MLIRYSVAVEYGGFTRWFCAFSHAGRLSRVRDWGNTGIVTVLVMIRGFE